MQCCLEKTSVRSCGVTCLNGLKWIEYHLKEVLFEAFISFDVASVD